MKPPTQANTTGWVLAGGQGARMGGVDKGLQLFQGQAMALRAVQRLRPQVNTVCINANRHLDDYRAWGYEVYPDSEQSFAGPLMGFLTGLENCPTEWLLAVPCDSPFFPMDLAARLMQVAHVQHTPIATVRAPELNPEGALELRPQPVFCLIHQAMKDSLKSFLASGGRKIDAWTSGLRIALLDFELNDQSEISFKNFNTPEDLV